MVIPDYSKWPGKLEEFSWLRTVAAIPMKVAGRVIGVIGVSFDEPDRAFELEDLELLQRFADLASIALDNAQLISSAVRQSQELRLLHEVRTAIARELDLTRIAKRTVEAIAETFGYTLVSLYMLEGDMLVLQHQVGYENVISKIAITHGIAGRVIRTGQPVFLDDVRSDSEFLEAINGIISEVAVPLFDEGKPVGILNIESRHGVKMTEDDLQLMLALSDQISIAISRARAYSTLRRKNERLSILHEISLELLNHRGLEHLPQTIADQIVRLLDANGGYITLREGDELVDRAVSPPGSGYQMTRTGTANTDAPIWEVYKSHQAFVTENFSIVSNIRPETAALGIQAALLLPILYGDTCQGVLGGMRFTPKYPFEEDDISFGNLFAKLAAVALDNAQLHETLRQESIRDPLTGLFNRRFMEEILRQELYKAERNAHPLAVVMLDLDHFKRINDTYGHDVGDEALRKLGLLLRTSFRGGDVACRYGGEEFAVILPGVSLSDAYNRMEGLRLDIKQLTVRDDGRTVGYLSGSLGIAVYPQHGTSSEQLLKLADEALYRAKQSGRDKVITA
jgi:diguanylate cyclase (GGDEF)-like protein